MHNDDSPSVHLHVVYTSVHPSSICLPIARNAVPQDTAVAPFDQVGNRIFAQQTIVQNTTTSERPKKAVWVTQAADKFLRLTNLFERKRSIIALTKRNAVTHGVIAYPVPLHVSAPCQVGRSWQAELISGQEKRRLDAMQGEEIQDRRRSSVRIGSIVKG